MRTNNLVHSLWKAKSISFWRKSDGDFKADQIWNLDSNYTLHKKSWIYRTKFSCKMLSITFLSSLEKFTSECTTKFVKKFLMWSGEVFCVKKLQNPNSTNHIRFDWMFSARQQEEWWYANNLVNHPSISEYIFQVFTKYIIYGGKKNGRQVVQLPCV